MTNTTFLTIQEFENAIENMNAMGNTIQTIQEDYLKASLMVTVKNSNDIELFYNSASGQVFIQSGERAGENVTKAWKVAAL